MTYIIRNDQHENSYFKRMTGIGPEFTSKRDEAERFGSREEAAQSPVMRFALVAVSVAEDEGVAA